MVSDSKVEDQLTVGFVRASHGLTGEFRVESASGRYEHIEVLKEVTLRHKGTEKKYRVESVDLGSASCYMKLAGIDSPEAAASINGSEIRVPRDQACPLEEDEWYIEDLKKCSLIYGKDDGLANGFAPVTVGSITDVLEGGSGYLLEVSLSESCGLLADNVKYKANGNLRKVLVPLVNEHIGKVDIENRTVQLMHLWILE